ncbi:MAG: hypothetical protein Q9187_003355 [Circinaria calcarea]
MDRSNTDKARLLGSRLSSCEDVTTLESPDGFQESPYISSNASTDDVESLQLHDFKHQNYGKRQWNLKGLAPKILPAWRKNYYLVILFAVISTLVLGTMLFSRQAKGPTQNPKQISRKWTKPAGFKIVGMVFYGRPPTVSILDCYLKRNLVTNGGFLDEVHWMVNTNDKYDRRYLDDLTNSTELYKKVTLSETGHWANVWAHATDNDTLYIKIDDDMVYIHDDAIPRMVQTRLAHPEAFDIAANIVNSPLTNWFHYHTGAVYPYLPEVKPSHGENTSGEDAVRTESWRPSELPLWNGTAEKEFVFSEEGDKEKEHQGDKPPDKQRWLPLPKTAENLLKTPIVKAEYNAWGRAWKRFEIATQQHYSLFENLERNQMGKYWFGDEEGIWNMRYERYNLNFLAIWGRDVASNPPDKDDEEDYTVTIPKKLLRREYLILVIAL